MPKFGGNAGKISLSVTKFGERKYCIAPTVELATESESKYDIASSILGDYRK